MKSFFFAGMAAALCAFSVYGQNVGSAGSTSSPHSTDSTSTSGSTAPGQPEPGGSMPDTTNSPTGDSPGSSGHTTTTTPESYPSHTVPDDSAQRREARNRTRPHPTGKNHTRQE